MAAVRPAGPEPMMMTLRGAVMCPSSPGSYDADSVPEDAPRGLPSVQTEDRLQVGEVADLVLGRGHALGQRLAAGIDPRGVHADPVGAFDVDVGAVAHEQRAFRRGHLAVVDRAQPLGLLP